MISRDWPRIFVATSVAIVGAWWVAATFFLKSNPSTPGGDDVIPVGMLVKEGDMIALVAPPGPEWGGLEGQEVQASVYEAKTGDAFVGVIPQDPRIAGLPQRIERRRVLRVTGRFGPSPSPGASVAYLGNPLVLENGRRYRARIELTGMEASFATSSAVKSTFEKQGFSDVQVYKDSPAGWPADATAAPGKGTWFTEGTWGAGNVSVARPAQIAKAWAVA